MFWPKSNSNLQFHFNTEKNLKLQRTYGTTLLRESYGICCPMRMAVLSSHWGQDSIGIAVPWARSCRPDIKVLPSVFHSHRCHTWVAGKLLTLGSIILSDFAPDEWFACYEQLLKIGCRLQRKCKSIFHGKHRGIASREIPWTMMAHGKLSSMGRRFLMGFPR